MIDRQTLTARRIAQRWGMNNRSNLKIGYASGEINRLNSDWAISVLSADAATKSSLKVLRARSRDLERNGGIQERYLSAQEANVIGPEFMAFRGSGLQMKITSGGETPDMVANDLIEKEWFEFCKKGNFDVTKKHSCNDFWRLTLRTVARDGDALVLAYRGYPNRWRLAFQLLEGDYIDDSFNEDDQNIRMGIELDAYRRKVAVWVLSKHPGDARFVDRIYSKDGLRGLRRRIPILGTDPSASVVALHITRPKRAEETRGVPWITPAMEAIKQLEGYEEAELVASRVQACKHIFYTSEMFTPQGDRIGEEDQTTGELVESVEPGMATDLPPGKKPVFYDPTHPNQAYPDFVKSIKRKISSALNCAYNTLFVDLESVNYSSIRAGLLDERTHFKMLQSWFQDDVACPSFNVFLEMALLSQAIPYSISEFDRLNHPEFKFRRWPWVDPRNDAQTAEILLRNRLTTRTDLIHDSSAKDFEDTMDQLDYECGYILDKKDLLALPDLGTDTSAQIIVNQGGEQGSGTETGGTPGATKHHSLEQPRSKGRFTKQQ
jgi:lambda family phage portal protein